MSLPRYDKYKDSGVEWLGEVPEHWNVLRLRFVSDINPSKLEVSHVDRDTLVSFLPMEAIGNDGSLDLEREKAIREVETGYTFFRNGDVAIAKITPCFENGKGALMMGLKNDIGFGTTELIVARPKKHRTTGTYLYRIFRSEPFMRLGEAEMYGAGGQKRVPDSFVSNFAIGLPQIEEQSAIAAFLDRETCKIDALVEEQQRLIELLKEKRQAVISHAVTKGLNPDVPMKDSGIEWLGEMPMHWAVKRTKYAIRKLEQGWSPQCENFPAEDGEWAVLKVGCVNGGNFNPDENKALPTELTAIPELGIHAGDVLISRANTRELAGSAAVAKSDYPRLLLCDKLYRLHLRDEMCLPEYLTMFLGTPSARGEIELSATGASSSMVNIGQATIREMPLPLPPLEEQERIATFITEETGKTNQLVAEATHAIDLLKERRTALISAAVTGKIDVRGLAAEDAA